MFKIYKFLDSKEKIYFHLLILISVFMNFFEVFSIGMILPILDFLINGKESNLLNNIEKFVPFEINLKSLLIFFISSILLKNIFYLINKYVIVDFTTKITNKVQIKILKKYLKQNLIFINENHSSKIAKDINVEAGVFSGSYVGPVLNSISQIIIFLFIIILLSFYNFKVTFFIFTFISLIAIIIKFFSSKKLKDLGVKRTNITGIFYRNIKEAIDFIREIKILNLYDHFTNKAEISLTNLKKVTIRTNMYSELPRAFLEISFAIFVVTFIILLFPSLGNQIIIQLALYVTCMFRLMPSVNNLAINYQRIKFSKIVVKKIEDYFKLESDVTIRDDHLHLNNSLKLQDLTFNYSKDNIFENLNFTIKKGDKIGLVGKSGEGKTTLINLIMGFLEPQKGYVLIDDKRINEFEQSTLLKLFSYVPQNVAILDDTLHNNITLYDSYREFDTNDLGLAIESAQLSDVLKKINSKKIKTLGDNGSRISFGERQRIGLARAFYKKAPIIVLDEATSYLDKKTEESFLDALDNNLDNKTLIFISHKKESLRVCEKIIEIKNKKIEVVK